MPITPSPPSPPEMLAIFAREQRNARMRAARILNDRHVKQYHPELLPRLVSEAFVYHRKMMQHLSNCK